jgi:sigma-B regulation protein RsbU (phosphoserine phosphatase)
VVVIMLLFFQPIYTQVDDFVRRIFIRSRSDYRHVMEQLSRDLITVFDTTRLATLVGNTLNREMFIERTYFAIYQENTRAFRIIGGSREFTLEPAINDMLINKQTPLFLNSIKKMVKSGSLVSHLIESNCQLVIPLTDKGYLIGVIATSPKVANFRYTYEDISLFSVLANQVVVSLNNTKLYAESLEKQRLEEELAVARQIQLNLLPKSVPEHDYYEFAAFNHPSRQVGGDYYDFLKTANGNICVVVADVSGKGVGSALLVARLQAVLQSEGQRGNPIHTMISGVNDFLVNSTSADKFVTMFYAELNCDKRNLNFCNAGHNYPFIVRKNNSIEYLEEGGLLLGVVPRTQYQFASVELNKGDVLVIYTDGLSEAFNDKGEEFGEKRLIETVREANSKSAQFICGHMIKTVHQFSANTAEEIDDMTVVVVKAK